MNDARTWASPRSAVPADPVADPVAALRDLARTLEHACEELFASVPFLGDQDTGYALNHYVDETVAALRSVGAEADDLLRAMSVAEQRRSAPGREVTASDPR